MTAMGDRGDGGGEVDCVSPAAKERGAQCVSGIDYSKTVTDAEARAATHEKFGLLAVCALCHVLPFVLVNRDFPMLDYWYERQPDVGLVTTIGRLWDSLMIRHSPFTICFGVSVAVHMLTYAIWSAPGFIFQFIPFMDRYKYQPARPWTAIMQLKCVRYVLLSQIGYQIPFSCMIYYFAEFMGFKYEFASIPKWYKLAIAMFGCSCVEDTWHFFIHWVMHYPPIYRRIHKIHHEFVNPFALTAEYAHPLEQTGLGIGFALGLIFFGNHIAHVWLWMACRTLQACEVHSGYDLMLFINPWRLFPWYAKGGHHDFHHENFVGNYASFYTWWDDIFDTSLEYRKRKMIENILKERSSGWGNSPASRSTTSTAPSPTTDKTRW